MLEFIAAEGGISLLEVNPGLAIWTTVTFLLVLFILQKFAWKPITSALDERANKIHEDLDRAERIRTDAESKLEECYLDQRRVPVSLTASAGNVPQAVGVKSRILR